MIEPINRASARPPLPTIKLVLSATAPGESFTVHELKLRLAQSGHDIDGRALEWALKCAKGLFVESKDPSQMVVIWRRV